MHGSPVKDIVAIFAGCTKTIRMNAVFIVLPILALLMFELGLTLQKGDFMLLLKNPKPVLVGLFGQIIALPVIAAALAWAFGLHGVFFIGLILIACCPGGSSSNIFSMLAKGDVALSVSLTALSSIITLFTLPLFMAMAVGMQGMQGETAIRLPVGSLLVQNLLLMLVPILAGIVLRRLRPGTAFRLESMLSRLAFPALMLLAAIFFVQHRQVICNNIGRLGACVTLLVVLATGCASLLSRLTGLRDRTRRTIVIEVGMQNAAQAIAVASSPFIFDNGEIAVPAIIYALVMNVVLLVYVGAVAKKHT